MTTLIITSCLAVLLLACSSTSSGTEKAAMPQSIKDEIRIHVENGLPIEYTIAVDGTKSFAKSNGGTIKLHKYQNSLETKVFIVPPDWANEALEYVKTIVK